MPSRSAPLQLDLFPPAAEPTDPGAASRVEPQSRLEPQSHPAPPGRGRGGAQALVHRLAALLPEPLRSLTLTDNRTRIVSARPAPGGGLDVRIHRSFAAASDDVLQAVADFLSSRRRGPRRRQALRVIREHFASHRPAVVPPKPRRAVLRPVGATLDLREVRDELNRVYFGGELEVAITWGRRPSRRRRRRRVFRRCGVSIRLGSYDTKRNVVRIHRCLDHPRVPRYVVESVVHHEMLHAAIPIVVVNGRRRIHTPEFRRREQLFRHHEKAERWIADNLEWLATKR